ncbi:MULTISPECIES: hypothetical protein [Devosia]|uniref:Uncharacterized protein n=1 Tax=Devosia equisanguinis TaxID=2490941 RepID=A0A3S4CB04_9HYPH|nr:MULTISPECIES: hypothetical protein [Devosia]ODU86156.1 MAG: hypothetical protein ABT14_10225 [Pelagibacterium sp. SCN 63-17]VDS04057.1 hypothetical protein DEVEQU_01188 [Devosia equisanguinis]
MRLATCFAVGLLMAMPAVAAPFHHPYGEWREYNRDWLAACPDKIDEDATDFYGYSCFASTGSQTLNGANLPSYKLTLVRNRLDGKLDLAITIAGEEGDYDPTRPMELRFGGEPPISLPMGSGIETRFNTINQFFITDDVVETGIIDKMKNRNAVTLSVPLTGRDQPLEVRLSLQGVLASLDFMDIYARKVAEY